MQELYALSSLLLEKINQALPQPHLKKIRFKHATPKITKELGEKKKNKKYSPHLLTCREQAALDKITDLELRSALEQFLMRCQSVPHS